MYQEKIQKKKQKLKEIPVLNITFTKFVSTFMKLPVRAKPQTSFSWKANSPRTKNKNAVKLKKSQMKIIHASFERHRGDTQ